MTIEELERRIAELRSRPLLLVCRTSRGKEQTMSLRECVKTGSTFLHIAADDLDALLSAELSVDNAPNCPKMPTEKGGMERDRTQVGE